MYRHASSTRRKDGSKNTVVYYRCKGTGNAPSKCGNMICADTVENMVHVAFADGSTTSAFTNSDGHPHAGRFATLWVMEQQIVSGNDHSVELADNALELAALDVDAPDYMAQVVTLSEERKRLQGLAVEPSSVELVPTGRTVGDVWAELDDAARRRYLVACGFKVIAAEKSARMVGDPSKLVGSLRTIAA